MQCWQREAVERAIAVMRRRLDHPLTIVELAEAACLSRSHFSRVFGAATGLSPARFLASLRVREAQRLLMATTWSVTDITHQVGYDGIGTFSSRFSTIVGVSPSTYRTGRRLDPRPTAPSGSRRVIEGRVRAADGPVVVGLFDRPAIHGRPRRWTIAEPDGEFRLERTAGSRCYVLARALDDEGDTAVRAFGGCVGPDGPTAVIRDLWLRPPRPIEPPALSALPVVAPVAAAVPG